MNNPSLDHAHTVKQAQLLTTLEGLLSIPATETKTALKQAAQLVNETLRADKTDVFLYDHAVDTLVAVRLRVDPPCAIGTFVAGRCGNIR